MNRPLRPALLLSALLGLALAAGTAAAGERHGTDLFTGYSFVDINESHRHGADLALGFDLGPLSGFVDVSSHWGSEAGLSLNDLTLMAGPGVRFGTRGGTVFSLRALAGLVRDKGTIGIFDVDISETSSGFGVLVGGGVDFRLSSKLAARLQGDYLAYDTGAEGIVICPVTGSCEPDGGGGWASSFRVSAGIVYRFGAAP